MDLQSAEFHSLIVVYTLRRRIFSWCRPQPRTTIDIFNWHAEFM